MTLTIRTQLTLNLGIQKLFFKPLKKGKHFAVMKFCKLFFKCSSPRAEKDAIKYLNSTMDLS